MIEQEITHCPNRLVYFENIDTPFEEDVGICNTTWATTSCKDMRKRGKCPRGFTL